MTGAELRTMRKAKRYTQQQLADAIGVSRKHVCATEGGPSVPRTMELAARYILETANL